MRSRRALLYVPGDDLHKIQKAITLGVDCICLDMEDGVALNRKDAARSTIVEALRTLDFGGAERLARINPVGSGLEGEDIAAALAGRPDGIVIPKVEDREHIAWVSDRIDRAEQGHGFQKGGICSVALVETARGIIHLDEISSGGPRLQALIFGAEDLAGDIGAQRSPEGWEVFFARSAVLTYAAAYNLQSIDMVFIDFNDLEGLEKEALQGANMGFSGKQIIHPNQVKPVQDAFTPDQEAITHALDILEAFNQHQGSGIGAFAMNGKMIDAPIVRAAERLLERARAAGRA
jgi:citrate lyase beta subunit